VSFPIEPPKVAFFDRKGGFLFSERWLFSHGLCFKSGSGRMQLPIGANLMPDWRKLKATTIVASSTGVFSGLAGMVHGLLEALQGNVRHSTAVINAIDPARKLWPEATLHAFTVVPSLLVAGLLAITAALLIAIWAALFIQRKYGAWVLVLLAILLFLVGGGFGPPFMALVAGLIATQISRPLSWWRTHLPKAIQGILAKLWPWPLIIYLLFFVASVEVAILGYPLVWFFSAEISYGILLRLGPISDIVLLTAILTAFAFDVRPQVDHSSRGT
jgi:hypothetical protein